MSKLFEDLREGLGEAINYAKSPKSVSSTRVRHFMPSEIQRVRAKTGLTQEQFATVIGSSVATLRKWEQGSRQLKCGCANFDKGNRLSSQHCERSIRYNS